MLMDAFVLSCLASVAYALSYKKLPGKVQRFLVKHGLFTDFLTGIITYFTLGGTLTAMTAGIMVGIITSALLYIINNPDDFLYLYDFAKVLQTRMAELKIMLNDMGREYREKKEAEARPVDAEVA